MVIFDVAGILRFTKHDECTMCKMRAPCASMRRVLLCRARCMEAGFFFFTSLYVTYNTCNSRADTKGHERASGAEPNLVAATGLLPKDGSG